MPVPPSRPGWILERGEKGIYDAARLHPEVAIRPRSALTKAHKRF
jgi:hypothetical protein